MLELTVKTLDSQNHSFTLPDEATVLNLKESILEKMEVPIVSQRLIFHGKVLQDNKKLTEYGDVNGKVIHLVQRAPPSATSRPSDGSSNRENDNGGNAGRRRRDGNATYLGSMAFPAFSSFGPPLLDNGMEIPTRPSQMMARNRIDCAKRMFVLARNAIQYMANPNSQPQPSASGRQRRQQPITLFIPNGTSGDDRGTPVDASTSTAEAPQEDISQSAAASAIAAAMNAAQAAHVPTIAVIRGSSTPVELSLSSDDLNFDEHHQDVAVEVEIESTDSSVDGRAEVEVTVRDNSTGNRSSARFEEGLRIDAMAPLLTDLENINTDLQPFLSRCRDLLTADNSFDDNSSPSYQEAVRVFGGVSETLHSIAHACHALSDLMVDFDEDAPRSLRCRPVVLQHSTILEAGIPLRLNSQEADAHINLRRVDVSGNRSDSANTGATPSNGGPQPPIYSGRTSAPSTSANQTQSQTPTSSSSDGQDGGPAFTSVQVGRIQMNGPDGIPGDLEIFMDFGVEPSFMSTASSGAPTRDSPTTATTTNNVSSTNTTTTSATPGTIPSAGIQINSFPPGMSTLVTGSIMGGSGQINLQPAVDAIAGHIRNQMFGSVQMRPRPTPTATSTTANASSVNPTSSLTSEGQSQPTTTRPAAGPTSSSSTSEPGAARTRINVLNTTTRGTTAAPEQAAAGSQTTPPRRFPHPQGMLDMLQTLFQGSFDPALPCNSHHIRASRPRQHHRVVARALGGRVLAVSVPQSSATAQPPPRRMPSRNVVMNEFGELNRPSEGSSNTPPAADFLNNLIGGQHVEGQSILSDLLMAMSEGTSSDSTAADFMNLLVGGSPVEGQSIVSDLLMTMARNVTLADLAQLLEVRYGVLESMLQRLRPVIHEFATQRLLQGETPSPEAIKQACERLFAEMRPLIDAMRLTQLRESVDLTATISNFNQAHLPHIISLIIEPNTNDFGSNLMNRLTVYVRQLVAIIIHCCVDNDHSFDSIVLNCVRQLTRGVPQPLQQWTEWQSVSNLHFYMPEFNVPPEDIQGYIVYRIPGTNAAAAPAATSVEPMETDATEKADENASGTLIAMETENLPEVVLGAEAWHNALPSEWVPVIARDTQRQRKQNSQKPFSDAYLSGMPPKRRKIIAASKPPGETLPQTISEGVRQAVEAAGVSSPLADRAIAEAGRDPSLQEAYKEQEKKTVGPKIKDDPDFKPSRFPNAHPYFK